MAEYAIRTLSGRMFDYAAPAPDMVDLGDIATALSQTARFGGHTRFYYSVAEHAVLVYRLTLAAGASPEVCLAALHHDSHEAYLGDVPTPLKSLLKKDNPLWDMLEHGVDRAIGQALGVKANLFAHPAVKLADRKALDYEAPVLKDGIIREDSVTGWMPTAVRGLFLETHKEAVAACR